MLSPNSVWTQQALNISLSRINQGLFLFEQALVDPKKHEAILTSVADISLVTSIIRRNSNFPETLKALMFGVQSFWTNSSVNALVSSPGPEAWSKFISEICIDTDTAKQNYSNSKEYRDRLRQSAQVILSLGPRWRPFEVEYIFSRIGKSFFKNEILNPFCDSLPLENFAEYELTHLIFYITDFGNFTIDEHPRKILVDRCISYLNKARDHNYDLELEILLALRYLLNAWHPLSSKWFEKIIPDWFAQYSESLAWEDYEFSIRFYHPMLISGLFFSENIDA